MIAYVRRVDGRGGWMWGWRPIRLLEAPAEPVRVGTLTDQEGQRLQKIVRRGSTSSVRDRRVIGLARLSGADADAVAARGDRAERRGRNMGRGFTRRSPRR